MSKEIVTEPVSYEGSSENVRYSVAVMSDVEGRPEEVKSGTISVFSTSYEGEPVNNSSAIVYYNGNEAVALSISHHDVNALSSFYESRVDGEGASAPDFYEFRSFYPPFPTTPQGDFPGGERVFQKDGKLVYEKEDLPLEADSPVTRTRVEVPLRLESDIALMLQKEGAADIASDSDHSSHEQNESEGATLLEEDIPEPYRATFHTNVIRQNG